MPSKKEILLLRYLNKVDTRYDNGKRGDTEKNIKANLSITENDINDMHYSELLQFSAKTTAGTSEPIVCITHKGATFIESYRYKKIRECFSWVFGFAAIIAAIFSVWVAFKK